MGRKGETTFERRELSQKAVEGITEDCLRTEAHCGNPDIVDLQVTQVIVHYEFSTDRDRYGTRAAIVSNTVPKPEPPREPEETLPRPRLLDADDAGREDEGEPLNLFDPIEYNDDIDLSQYHDSDATGEPYGEPDRTVSPHGETLTEGLEFEEDDIAEPLRKHNAKLDGGAFNGH